MAWSLHLSQPSGTMLEALAWREVQPPGPDEPIAQEEFVLWALCRLLDAAPYYSIIPIIPKLREFVAWFDNPKLIEYQSMISARIEGAVNRHQECKISYNFQKFHCMLYL